MKNNLLIVNDLLTVNSISTKETVKQSILDSEALTDTEKAKELVFLENAMPAPETIDVGYIRQNFNKTKLLPLYAYLIETTPQDNLLNVNFLGSLGGLVKGIFGSETQCGVFGSIFNTKSCKEKKELVKQTLGAQASPQPQPNILQQLASQPITPPQVTPTALPSYAPAAQNSQNTGQQSGQNNFFNQSIAGIPVWLIAAAVLLFLFMNKKRRR